MKQVLLKVRNHTLYVFSLTPFVDLQYERSHSVDSCRALFRCHDVCLDLHICNISLFVRCRHIFWRIQFFKEAEMVLLFSHANKEYLGKVLFASMGLFLYALCVYYTHWKRRISSAVSDSSSLWPLEHTHLDNCKWQNIRLNIVKIGWGGCWTCSETGSLTKLFLLFLLDGFFSPFELMQNSNVFLLSSF